MPATVVLKYRSEEDGEGPFLKLLNPGEEGGRGKRVPLPSGLNAQDAVAFAATLLNFAGIAVEANLDRDRDEEIEDRVKLRARDAADEEERRARKEARAERQADRNQEAKEAEVQARETREVPPDAPHKGKKPEEYPNESRAATTSGGRPQTQAAGTPLVTPKVGPKPPGTPR